PDGVRGGARRRALRVDARRDRRRARQRAGAGYPARDVAGDRATAGADPRAEALDPRARPASCTRATDLVVRSDTRDAAHRGVAVMPAEVLDARHEPALHGHARLRVVAQQSTLA